MAPMPKNDVHSARSAWTTSTLAALAAGTTDAITVATNSTTAEATIGTTPGNCTS